MFERGVQAPTVSAPQSFVTDPIPTRRFPKTVTGLLSRWKRLEVTRRDPRSHLKPTAGTRQELR